MNDFDYDALQKKRIARGAAHMKRGSKSKKCSLPSDHMTAAEWKRRNGPVSTYKLDAPMSWDEFKAMPLDLRKKYLNNLYELYGASDARIASMMRVNAQTISRARAEVGIIRTGARVGADELARREAMWLAFCNGVVGGGRRLDTVCDEQPEPRYDEETAERMDDEPEVEETIQETMTPEEEPTPVEIPREVMFDRAKETIKPDPLSLDYLTATFSGDFSPELFVHWVTRLPMPAGKVRIKVEVAAL